MRRNQGGNRVGRAIRDFCQGGLDTWTFIEVLPHIRAAVKANSTCEQSLSTELNDSPFKHGEQAHPNARGEVEPSWQAGRHEALTSLNL